MTAFLGFLGWALILGAAAAILSGLRSAPDAGAAGAPVRRKRLVAGGLAGLVLGIVLAMVPRVALARMTPVDLSRRDNWRTHPVVAPGSPVRWEDGVLVADLEAGSGRYAVIPVDWDANRFVARWDITFTHLDREGDTLTLLGPGGPTPHRRGRQDYAAVAVGLMDQNVANIDDRDHVSGSAIEACFSDDIRLRASDANYIVRTSSAVESGSLEVDPHFKPGTPVRVELNRTYRCEMAYDAASRVATLRVRGPDGAEVVSRRLEDLKDFTNSVSWFGVSVRGYNRFDKKLDPQKSKNGYTRPRAVVRVENMEYLQP